MRRTVALLGILLWSVSTVQANDLIVTQFQPPGLQTVYYAPAVAIAPAATTAYYAQPAAACCEPAAPVAQTAYYGPAPAAAHATYYAPAAVATSPTVVYSPVIAPTTTYYAPTTAYYAPTTAYYAPAVTAYYSPAVTAYYAPGAVVAPTTVVAGRPAIVRSTVYYPGQPIRNFFRALGP
jgi:hypothetical protein